MQDYGQTTGFIITLRQPPELSELRAISGVTSAEPLTDNQFRILHTPEDNPTSLVLSQAACHGWQLEQLTPLHATLEDIFVKITGDESAQKDPQP